LLTTIKLKAKDRSCKAFFGFYFGLSFLEDVQQPLIFYFYKRESYNNLCISKHQCSLAYTANHITHRLKETQDSKMAYKKKGACIQVQLEFRMQALLSSPFI
jgi:hypothetical protein